MPPNHPKEKVVIFGATGKTGRCLVLAGLSLGHRITAFVRSPEKLAALLGPNLPDGLTVIRGDALDPDSVGEAMSGHNIVVNAAGHPTDARTFENLCRTIVTEADEHLDHPRRLWQFGGLPGLTVPHTRVMGCDLPGMPAIFRSHRVNYEVLKKTGLDWSFLCPGPMFFAGHAGPTVPVRTTTEFMPYPIAPWTRFLPRPIHPFIMMRRLKTMTVSYEAVAWFVMTNLSPSGAYSHQRVGIAPVRRNRAERQPIAAGI